MLSFTQVNLHQAAQATSLAGQLLEENKQNIMLLTEPYTCANKVVGMPRGTSSVYASLKGPGPPPRAAIIASLGTKLTAMDNWCNRDCAVGLVKIRGKQTIIASIYLDINKEVQPPWLDGLMDMASTKGFPMILGIDSNAHSTMFGPDGNTRGNQFEDFILQYGLRVENTGSIPTFETQRGNKLIQTYIDVTLTRGLHLSLIHI